MFVLSHPVGLKGWCRQALHYLRHLFWGCLWLSGEDFKFSYTFTFFHGRRRVFGQVGDFHVFNHWIGPHIRRLALLKGWFMFSKELECSPV